MGGSELVCAIFLGLLTLAVSIVLINWLCHLCDVLQEFYPLIKEDAEGKSCIWIVIKKPVPRSESELGLA